MFVLVSVHSNSARRLINSPALEQELGSTASLSKQTKRARFRCVCDVRTIFVFVVVRVSFSFRSRFVLVCTRAPINLHALNVSRRVFNVCARSNSLALQTRPEICQKSRGERDKSGEK